MNVIFNGVLTNEEDIKFTIENRAFQYGDGVFETMIFEEGQVSYLADHLERLGKGLKALSMDFPPQLTQEVLTELLLKLLAENGLNRARIKLIAWRKAGGLFSPTEKTAEYLILTKPHTPSLPTTRKLDFAESITLSPSPVSPFKRLSSASYILAGIEMKQKGLDDIILLDHNGNIAECLYSNIFWVKEGIYFTPSLETGCIEGVRRKNIIKQLVSTGKEVKIVQNKPEKLFAADFVFSTNVAGIYPITQIEDKEFPLQLPDID